MNVSLSLAVRPRGRRLRYHAAPPSAIRAGPRLDGVSASGGASAQETVPDPFVLRSRRGGDGRGGGGVSKDRTERRRDALAKRSQRSHDNRRLCYSVEEFRTTRRSVPWTIASPTKRNRFARKSASSCARNFPRTGTSILLS